MDFKNINERENFSNINNLLIKTENKDIKNQIIKRNYGIDLLRIISMINIINLHVNMFSGQLNFNYTSPKFVSIWRLEIFSYHAVDSFGLISGVVGYKRYKFSNLIYLWFLASFYSTTISLYLFVKDKLNKKNLILSLFPILIKRHWYLNAYFSMYLLLPFINYGINSLNRKVYKNLIIFFILFFSIYNIIAKIYGNTNYHFLNNGYSSMWLTILYIIGAYFGKFIIINKKNKNIVFFCFWILIYIFCSFFNSEIYFHLLKKKSTINNQILISYLSPTILLQAISFIILFSQLNINNKWILKIISFLSPLTFSAQLIHAHLFKENIKIKKILFKFINKFKVHWLFFKIYGLVIIIYFICVFIDYFRLQLFKLFKIKEFSIFLEKEIPLLFDKLISNSKIANINF